MVAYSSGYSVGTVDSSNLPVPHLVIEILKKKFLSKKTKILAYCSGHRVGTVNTTLSPVRFPDIYISK